MAKPIINIWTIQIAQWRVAQEMNIELLDITAKSGISAFAPDWFALTEYKQGRMSEENYSSLYLDKMRLSLKQETRAWEHLKQKENIALACYCRAGDFCHRHLFKDMMEKYLKSEGYDVCQKGEIQHV